MRLLHLGSFDFKVFSHSINEQLEIAEITGKGGKGTQTIETVALDTEFEEVVKAYKGV